MATRKSVEEGKTISEPLADTDVFPSMVVQMIAVGEQTGALDTMLSKIADFYEDEVDTAVAGLMKLLEPLLIAFLGVAIGGIVIAMYMPMFTLIGQIGKNRLRVAGAARGASRRIPRTPPPRHAPANALRRPHAHRGSRRRRDDAAAGVAHHPVHRPRDPADQLHLPGGGAGVRADAGLHRHRHRSSRRASSISYIQIFGDLCVETLLVYFTGAPRLAVLVPLPRLDHHRVDACSTAAAAS